MMKNCECSPIKCLIFLNDNIVVPIVHLVPFHPSVQLQVFGAVQIPSFGQELDPQHSAERNVQYKLN